MENKSYQRPLLPLLSCMYRYHRRCRSNNIIVLCSTSHREESTTALQRASDQEWRCHRSTVNSYADGTTTSREGEMISDTTNFNGFYFSRRLNFIFNERSGFLTWPLLLKVQKERIQIRKNHRDLGRYPFEMQCGYIDTGFRKFLFGSVKHTSGRKIRKGRHIGKKWEV